MCESFYINDTVRKTSLMDTGLGGTRIAPMNRARFNDYVWYILRFPIQGKIPVPSWSRKSVSRRAATTCTGSGCRVLIIIIIMLIPRKLNGATRRGTANCEDLVGLDCTLSDTARHLKQGSSLLVLCMHIRRCHVNPILVYGVS